MLLQICSHRKNLEHWLVFDYVTELCCLLSGPCYNNCATCNPHKINLVFKAFNIITWQKCTGLLFCTTLHGTCSMSMQNALYITGLSIIYKTVTVKIISSAGSPNTLINNLHKTTATFLLKTCPHLQLLAINEIVLITITATDLTQQVNTI